MKLLYSDRPEEEQAFIKEVCNYILSQPAEEKEPSNEFAFVFVDGRPNVDFSTLEYQAMIHSCRAFSKFRYPIYGFVNHIYGLLDATNEVIGYKIQELNSLEEYSKFMIEKVFSMLPNNIKHIITIQADGMLLRNGWEDFVIKNDFDLLGSHWRHTTGLDYLTVDNVYKRAPFPNVYGCNLGFSFRKLAKIKEILRRFRHIKFRQSGDSNCPEDVFFSFLGFNHFKQGDYPSPLCKLPTLKECDLWATDPLTLDIWKDKENWPFGFHYFKTISEFPPCSHE
jgi:hypothetical protein